MTGKRLFLLVIAAALLAACGAHAPAGRTIVPIDTHSYAFLGQVESREGGRPDRVRASFMLPEAASAKVPAVVLLHGSTGQGAQEWYYADLLNSWGVAVLAVDSFAGRDVEDTLFDQSAVSEASMMADAYAALNLLSRDPRIDPYRIGLIGFSKGGGPALLAALDRYRKVLAEGRNRFALHVAFYPWCGFSFQDETATGAPILILSGGMDRVTPAALCAVFAGRLRRDNPGLPLEMETYPAGGHAFDYPHPVFRLLGELPVRGNIPGRCFFEETAPGTFRERSSDLTVTAENVRYALSLCSAPDPDAAAIYDPAGAEDARRRLRTAVGAALLGQGQQASTLAPAKDQWTRPVSGTRKGETGE
jgi:dienelactone hydrolase